MPVRTCCGCGRKAEQRELWRFRAEEGVLTRGGSTGRSTYTCPSIGCFEEAVARKGFARALRRSVAVPPGLV